MPPKVALELARALIEGIADVDIDLLGDDAIVIEGLDVSTADLDADNVGASELDNDGVKDPMAELLGPDEVLGSMDVLAETVTAVDKLVDGDILCDLVLDLLAVKLILARADLDTVLDLLGDATILREAVVLGSTKSILSSGRADFPSRSANPARMAQPSLVTLPGSTPTTSPLTLVPHPSPSTTPCTILARSGVA